MHISKDETQEIIKPDFCQHVEELSHTQCHS